jgi:hypothetical protein
MRQMHRVRFLLQEVRNSHFSPGGESTCKGHTMLRAVMVQ